MPGKSEYYFVAQSNTLSCYMLLGYDIGITECKKDQRRENGEIHNVAIDARGKGLFEPTCLCCLETTACNNLCIF